MKRFLIALQFLTILPIKIKSDINQQDFGSSLLYFPIIGILIGFLLSATAFFLSSLPNLVMGAVVLITSVIITGGVHLDGFADTCDGLYGSKPREKILEIMRDSRIGVMGVIGIVTLLLLKFSLIVNISQNLLWKSLILMATFARWSQVLCCYTSNYARKDGKAKFFVEYANRKDVIIGGLFTFVLFLSMAELKGILVFILTLLFTLLFIGYVKRRIGGMTGDTIGAISEVAEVVILFFVILVHL